METAPDAILNTSPLLYLHRACSDQHISFRSKKFALELCVVQVFAIMADISRRLMASVFSLKGKRSSPE